MKYKVNKLFGKIVITNRMANYLQKDGTFNWDIKTAIHFKNQEEAFKKQKEIEPDTKKLEVLVVAKFDEIEREWDWIVAPYLGEEKPDMSFINGKIEEVGSVVIEVLDKVYYAVSDDYNKDLQFAIDNVFSQYEVNGYKVPRNDMGTPNTIIRTKEYIKWKGTETFRI